MNMDEGAFDQNFTWYEWGFVSPSEVPSEDLAVPTTGDTRSFHVPSLSAYSSSLTAHGSPKDHRWPT
jgi:hypothetical protein